MLIKNQTFIKKFGEKVKEIRLARNISQEELANIAEIPISQVGRIERGEINTTLVTLKALADALRISPADFFEKKK